MTANVRITQVLLKRGNTAAASNYTGPIGEVVIDTGLRTLRIQDGTTAGGHIIQGSSNVDLSSYATKTQLASNIATVNGNIVTANTAMKGYVDAQISSYTPNLSSYATVAQLSANVATLTANAAVQDSKITGANAAIVTANTALKAYTDTAISTAINNLINSAPGTLDTLGEIAANLASGTSAVGAITNSITSTNANVTAANVNIATLFANAASQSADIATLTANAAAQQTQIGELQANVGGFYTWANTNFGTSSYSNANVTAYLIANPQGGNYSNVNVQAYIGANVGSFYTYANATYSTIANAATQAGQLTTLTANAASQATAIADLQTQVYSNVNAAAYLSGNVTTGNLTVSENAVVLGNLRVQGTQTTVNAATLTVDDLWITVANGAAQSSDANGAGLRVAGALANIAYSSVSDSFEFNKPITVGNVIFSNNTRFANNSVTLPNGQGFNWNFYDPMIGGDTVNLYMNELTTGWATWSLTTGDGANSWVFDSDAQEFSLFNGGAGGKLVFGTAANAGVRSSIDDVELKSTNGNVYITANANPWTFSETGNLILPTRMNFMTSPAISGTGIVFGDGSYQYTAWTGLPGNELVNGVHTASLDTTGNLNVPGDILPLVDNLYDLGSPTYRFRHLYVGPGTVYVGNAAIKTTATGNLILPGLTRAVASSSYVESVEDEDDQTQTFTTVPTVIDNAYYSYLNGNLNNLSFTTAEYSVDQLDGEGYIDGITVDVPGSGYAGEVARLAEQNMWATEVATPFASFDANDWIQIPFRAETRAGESEYEFTQGGGSGDRLVNDDHSVVLDADGNTTFSGTITMGNGDAVIGQDGDDFVISWDNEALVLRAEQDDVQVQADRSFQIDTDYAGSYKRWVFDTNGYLVHTTGDTQVYSELGSLTLQGGAVGLGSGNVNIVAVETGVAVQTWAFGNDGVLTLPSGGDIVDSNGASVLGGGSGSGNTGLIRFDGVSTAGIYNVNGGGITISNFSYQTDEAETAYIRIPDGNSSDTLIIQQEQGPVAITANTQTWEFGTSGRLYLPSTGSIEFSDGTIQTTAYTGGSGNVSLPGLSTSGTGTSNIAGSLVYTLGINTESESSDGIQLKVYAGGDDAYPAISIGQDIGGTHRANVVAIGNNDVGYNSLPGGVYIGHGAGFNDTEQPQGLHSIAIGSKAAWEFATNNSITLNATGNELNPDESGLFIKPIREEQYDDLILYYNADSGEVTYSTNTGGGAAIGNTAPTSVNGRLWYNTEDGRTYVYALDTWIDASPSVVPGNMVGYDTDGNITLRDDASINYANGVSIINSVYGDAEVADFLEAYTSNIAKIGSDPLSLFAANIKLSSDNSTWAFSSTGNIVFPDGSEQATAYTGGEGGGSNYGNVDLAAFMSSYQGNIYINSESSGLIVDAAGDKRVGFMKYFGIESSFVHANGPTKSIPFRIGRVAADDITQANSSVFTTEIFISNVGKIGIHNTSPAYDLDLTGNAKVSGNLIVGGNITYANGVNILSNLAVSTGNITFDGSEIITPDSSITLRVPNNTPTGVANWEGGGGWNQGFYGNLATTGGTGTGLTVDVAAGGGGYINISAISIHTPGTGYTDGDVITINNENNIPGTFTITVPTNDWAFSANGALTTPGSVIMAPGGRFITNGNTGTTASHWYNYPNTDHNWFARFYSDEGANLKARLGLENLSNITIETTGDVDGLGNAGPDYKWSFGGDGSTTFPDHQPVTITGNLTVGNLTVTGNTTTINTQSYTVVDNIIQMATDNPADTLDLGFVAHRTVDSTLQHTGLVRDASTGKWALFSNVVPQPGNTIDLTYAILDDLLVGTVQGTDFKFANGVSILSTISSYSDVNVAAYLSSSTATVANLVITGSAPGSLFGSAGDTAGTIRTDDNYIYYCTDDYADQHYTAVAGTQYVNTTYYIIKGSYPQPQVGWLFTSARYGADQVITGVVDGGGLGWGIQVAGVIGNNGTIAQDNNIGFYNPTYPTIWKQLPWSATNYSNVNVAAYLSSQNITSYGNTQVAAYLVANPQAGTYSNTNVAAYLTTSSISTTGNITAGNVIGTHYGNAVGTTATYAGSVTASNFIGNVTGNITGNLTGTTPNVSLVAGSYTTTFDNTGTATFPGAIVMPSRPAFRIYGGSPAWFNTSNVNLKGSSIVVDYNQGNYFNQTTGVFTAPIAGLYSVTLNARVGSNNGANQILVGKNGLATAGNVAVMWECDTNTGTAVHFGVATTTRLAAGDWLSANITLGNIQFDQNDSWTVTYLG